MQMIIRTLTWTFIHSLWQGLLAALLAAIVISCTRRATASLRYNLLSTVMILFFAASAITFITQWPAEEKLVTALPFTTDDDIASSTSGLTDNFTAWVNANSGTVILVWTFFFLLSCLKLVTGLAAVNRLRHYKTHPVTKEWKAKLEQLQRLIGVRDSVSLLQSELVKVPMALGILKPIIFIPIGLLSHLPPEQVETILLHELAHVRRRDYLVNLLQHLAEAIFFFNPAVRWLSFLIRQEREACCDDIVVASCNQKSNYLNALISIQEYSLRHSSYAMAIGCKRHYLLNRVQRMITNKNKGINLFEKIALLCGMLLFSAFSFVTNEKEMRAVTIQHPPATVLSDVRSKPEFQSLKKKKTNLFNKPVADTVPVKKKKNGTNNNNKQPLPKLTEQEKAAADADAALQEIVQLKNQIGVKKESIGIMKEQLKTKEGPEKEKILNEIKREREEIDGKRKELDSKRIQWNSLKEKAKEKQQEEKSNGEKTVTDHEERSATIENEHDAKQWDINDVINGDLEKTISAYFAMKFEIDNNKVNKKEFKYEMKLQQKNPPPIASPAAPGNITHPVGPAKRVRQ